MATLISAGHPPSYVLDDYTWDEIQVHYEAAIRQDAYDRRNLALMNRISHHAKDRTFKKYLRQLEETGERLDRDMGRTRDSTNSIIAGIDRVLAKRQGR